MAKRFTDTSIWDEDWFIDLPKDYCLFWFYVKDNCDHAGIWRPNVSTFNKLFSASVSLKEALSFWNKDKERIQVLEGGRWLIIGFIAFQYGSSLNPNNRVHKSILELLKDNGVNLTSIRPQFEEIEGLKDKDKDKEKDKEKDKDKIKEKVSFDEDGLVLLTQEEHKKLLVKLGERKTAEYVKKLAHYIGSKGKRYHSHYHTILSWISGELAEVKPIKKALPGNHFDPKTMEKWKAERDKSDLTQKDVKSLIANIGKEKSV